MRKLVEEFFEHDDLAPRVHASLPAHLPALSILSDWSARVSRRVPSRQPRAFVLFSRRSGTELSPGWPAELEPETPKMGVYWRLSPNASTTAESQIQHEPSPASRLRTLRNATWPNK